MYDCFEPELQTPALPFYGSHHLGSVRSVVKASAALDKYDYRPFGSLNWSSSGTTKREGYIGKEMDKESNLDDFGVRKYDTEIGRSLSVDPLREAQPGYTPSSIFSIRAGEIFHHPNPACHIFFR